jgi:hypothetical protein
MTVSTASSRSGSRWFGRDGERDAGVADLVLGARQALAHRLERDEEGAGDLFGGETAERAQREPDLRVERERRVAAGEDQLEPLVRELRRLVDRLLRSFSQFALQLLGLHRQRPLPPDTVDRAVASGRDQPPRRVSGDSVARPAFGGGGERILRGVFGQLDLAEKADERGQDTAPLVAEDLLKHR